MLRWDVWHRLYLCLVPCLFVYLFVFSQFSAFDIDVDVNYEKKKEQKIIEFEGSIIKEV